MGPRIRDEWEIGKNFGAKRAIKLRGETRAILILKLFRVKIHKIPVRSLHSIIEPKSERDPDKSNKKPNH
jgi:hypothetical protein